MYAECFAHASFDAQFHNVWDRHNVCDIDNSAASDYKHCMEGSAIYGFIGAAIKRRRKQLRMTQEQLAALMGNSRASLANVETGRQGILIHQIFRFAENLNVKVEDLLPPQLNTQTASSPSDLPLPKGLNPVQKEQITRLLGGVSIVATDPPKKGKNVSQAKERSKS